MAGSGMAQAQQGTGVLSGTVFDNATKKPMPDVLVMVSSPALQEDQVVVTDASGFYRIPNLPPGTYKIRYEKDGYFPNESDGIAVRADVTFRLNPSLALAQGEPTQIVVKVRPTVDVGSSSSGANLNSDLLRRVPVSAPGGKGSASRSFESVAEVGERPCSFQLGVALVECVDGLTEQELPALTSGHYAGGTLRHP